MKYGILVFFFLLISCDVYQSQPKYIKELQNKGDLVLISRNSLATYYSGRDDKWTGFDYDLAKAFASSYQLNLRVEVAHSAEEALQALPEDKNYIVGAGLSLTQERQEKYRFSDPYLKIKQRLVCHRFGKQAQSRKDLLSVRILVGSGTSYEQTLKNLKRVLPDLNWEAKALNSEEALFKINNREADCTIVDSNILALQQRLYPNLKAMFDLSPIEGIRWFVQKDNYHMQRLLNQWLKKNQKIVLALQEKYFGYLQGDYDYYDKKVFERRIQQRLPKWKKLFQRAAKRTGYDWKLLAALSYQESHWDNSAVSPTGVRGLMMLTLATAKRMKITNRLDPKQSVIAGAKYLKILERSLKNKVPKDDLLWVSLASYNVGLGHILDVIDYLEQKDRIPNWRNIKEILPLLTKESFFKNLKYGYANGNEPLVYVDRIRDFYQILSLKK